MATLVSFNSLLDEKMGDPEFAAEFEQTLRALEFSAGLAMLREARGLTQREVSERTGIAQPMIARIERGQLPNTPTLRKLARALQAEIRIRPDGSVQVIASEELAEAA